MDSPYHTKPSQDTPNPLRPYYVPPSIGIPSESGSGAARNSSSPRPNPGFGEIFSDLDYGDYLNPSASATEMAKRFLDQAVWSYTSVVLAQPFEVAKVILQCHLADAGAVVEEQDKTRRGHAQEYPNSDSDSDESEAPSYFVPTSPDETPSQRPPPRRRGSARSQSSLPNGSNTTIVLLRPDSVLDVLSQLWSKEGAWGVWKGTNSTFVYSVLLRTIETWSRSLLSALLNLPEPSMASASSAIGGVIGGTSILDSPSPLGSIAIVVGSAAMAGLILAPLDMVRTRLILTPTRYPPRALLPSFRTLPSVVCPPTLLPITLVHSIIPSLVSTSLPLFLRSSLRIDPIHTPGAYSVSSFLVALVELFVKLPLETVMRRGHVAALTEDTHSSASASRKDASILPLHSASSSPQKFRPILPVGPYKGIFGTVWFIMYEEGFRDQSAATHSKSTSHQSIKGKQNMHVSRRQQQQKRGQGLKGLWRGWRIGFWGVVGIWVASGIGGTGQAGGEF